jgi:drug/metabolite transporter (DMT)-like permease
VPGTSATRARIWAALVVVYVLWGSTYIGILVAVRTFPPFLMGAVRFLIAGGLLYAWSIRRGDREGDRPGRKQWAAAALVGGLLLVSANGLLCWAEQNVDSGVSSLVIATVPLWMALFDRVGYGQRLSRSAVAGLVVGLAGAAILAGPSGGHIETGAILLVISAVSWAAGSILSRRSALPKRPLVGASMQMLAGGAMLAVVGLAAGEGSQISHVSSDSLLALGYLIVFGSLIGFSAYIWLLRSAPTSLVSTYAYVNPVVAVFLGWALESEPIGARTVVAGAMILLAVALIVRKRPASAQSTARVPAAAPARAS